MAAGNLVTRAPVPLPFYIARATGAHQPDGLGAPDQGELRESDSAFGPSREINPNKLVWLGVQFYNVKSPTFVL